MASPTQDRLFGANSSLAIKAPCRAATTANITLSALQTVDGVALAADDRVLVKDQTAGAENGIYLANTSAWKRSPDWDGTRDIATGTVVYVTAGSTNIGFWYLTTTGTITIGTTAVTIARASTVLATVSALMQTLLDDTEANTPISRPLSTVAGTNTITAVVTPALTAYAAGQRFWFRPANDNTAATTVNIDAVGAKNVFWNGAALTGGELQAAVPVELEYDGTQFNILGNGSAVLASVGADGDSVVRSTGATKGAVWIGGNYGIVNGSITASVAAKALTVALKTDAGADPSDTDPVFVDFRHATIGTGTVLRRKVTAALSVVVPNGGTLGFTAAETARIRVGLIDNAGTPELCVWKPVVGTAPSLSIFSPSEDVLVTTVAVGAGSDSAGVVYSTTLRSNVAFRHAGFLDIATGAVAGEWDNAPAKIQSHGPGVKLPGDVVQLQYTQTGAVATGTTTVPNDDTIPQSTEGDQYLSQAITPTDAQNLLRVRSEVGVGNSALVRLIMALFQDATASALAASSSVADNTGAPYPLALTHLLVAGTTSATTFKIRCGGSAAGTTTLNGDLGARTLGGIRSSNLGIEEIMT